MNGTLPQTPPIDVDHAFFYTHPATGARRFNYAATVGHARYAGALEAEEPAQVREWLEGTGVPEEVIVAVLEQAAVGVGRG